MNRNQNRIDTVLSADFAGQIVSLQKHCPSDLTKLQGNLAFADRLQNAAADIQAERAAARAYDVPTWGKVMADRIRAGADRMFPKDQIAVAA